MESHAHPEAVMTRRLRAACTLFTVAAVLPALACTQSAGKSSGGRDQPDDGAGGGTGGGRPLAGGAGGSGGGAAGGAGGQGGAPGAAGDAGNDTPAAGGAPGAGGTAGPDAQRPPPIDASTGGPPDGPAPATTGAAATLVAGLAIERFKDNIKAVAAFGDRTQGSPSFDTASAWLAQQLKQLGYTVEHHDYTYQGGPRTNTFATKVGSKFPDRMYLLSAHLDGRGGGGGADDDGSGVSIVLELARALAAPGVETDVSVRFAFWDNEETGLDGARAYVRDRAALQGVESPPGSRRYPEPRWLGVIQHDMMLYDHGLPPGPQQAANADIDIDYQASSKMAAPSRQLAMTLAAGAKVHAKEYPTDLGSNMEGTDSVPFQDIAPAVSVREAKRVEEILRGSNPNHHKPTDVFTSYSEADFRLGFNALETTLGTVAELAGARIAGAP
jgi:hypothetical protein